MKTTEIRAILAVSGADLKSRLRSHSYWITVIVCSLAAWNFFPAADAGYVTIALPGKIRPLYSSAWIGMMISALGSLFLTLIGFYLVRGTVVRDFESRVWQLLVITTMSRRGYLLAKWLSHLCVLSSLLFCCLCVGLGAQWWRAEDLNLSALAALPPMLIIAFPSLAVVSALAIWFDLMPWSRKTLGNIAFIFVWGLLINLGAPARAPEQRQQGMADVLGVAMLSSAVDDAASMLPGVSKQHGFCGICATKENRPAQTYVWSGWHPATSAVIARLTWLLLAGACVIAATPFLDRFAARTEAAQANQKTVRVHALTWLGILLKPIEYGVTGRMMSAELQALLRRRSYLWWLCTLTCLVVEAAAPFEVSCMAAIGGWLLVIDALARTTLTERLTDTGALVWTAAKARVRLSFSRSGMLLMLMLMMTLPALIRAWLHSPLTGASALLTCTSLTFGAMSLSSLSGQAKVTEALILFASYVSLQGVPWISFVNADSTYLATHVAITLGAIIVTGLLALRDPHAPLMRWARTRGATRNPLQRAISQ